MNPGSGAQCAASFNLLSNKKMMMKYPGMALLFVAACSTPAWSSEDAASRSNESVALPMKTVRVALFKNDCGFVTMRGTLGEGVQFHVQSLPKPVLGSFWVMPAEGVRPRSLLSRIVERKKEIPIQSFGTLAEKNPWARCACI